MLIELIAEILEHGQKRSETIIQVLAKLICKRKQGLLPKVSVANIHYSLPISWFNTSGALTLSFIVLTLNWSQISVITLVTVQNYKNKT